MKAMTIMALLFNASLGFAHGLEYTLVQEGFKKALSCESKRSRNTTVEVFKSNKKAVLIFKATDEDKAVTNEMVVTVSKTTVGHDETLFSGSEGSLNVAAVGEEPLPAVLSVNRRAVALQIWLKTYGQSELVSDYECVARGE